MPPRSRPTCQICQTLASKYNCPKCKIPYCSLGCYKTHQEEPVCVSAIVSAPSVSPAPPPAPKGQGIEIEESLRPLTSLKWPYVPEESAYADPLKRDDPKVVQLPQYEAIATSVGVREVLSEHPDLKPLLRSIDSLRGREREAALQRALGVSRADLDGDSSITKLGIGQENIEAMRRLSSAVEAAIRGERPGALGLDFDWEPR